MTNTNAFTQKPDMSKWAKQIKHSHTGSQSGTRSRLHPNMQTPLQLKGSRPMRKENP